MDTGRRRKFFYGWVIVAGCMLLSAGGGILSGVISIFIKPVSEALGVDRSLFTLYTTINLLATMLVLPMAPGLFKKVRFKRLVLAGALVTGGAIFCFSFARSVYVFYGIAAVAGVGACFMNAVPIVILTSNWFVNNRGIATSISFSGMGISSICLSPVVSAVIIKFGWEAAYRIVAAAFLLFTVPAICFLIREKPEEMGLKALGTENADVPGGEAPGGEAPRGEAPAGAGSGFTRSETVKTKAFLLFAAGIFLSSLISYGVLQHFVSYLSDVGWEPTAAAGWFSALTVVMTVAKAFTGRLYEKEGIKKSCLLLSGMLFLALLVFGGAGKMPYLVIFILLFGLSSGLQIVPPTYMTNMFFGDRDYSANYGLVTTIYYCGMAAGVQLSALLFDCVKSYRPAWILYGALTLAMLALWLLAGKRAVEERRRLLQEEVELK